MEIRFSGADISILVRDACYEPLRKAQNAFAFKPVGYNASGNPIYEPCAPSEPGAVQKKMWEFKSDEIQLPIVSMVRKYRKTIKMLTFLF